jgi:pimeloyl-ACP methyl ester carboxylesterase
VYDSLRLAAFNFAIGMPELGNAFADLSVTGRKSFAQFKAINMTDEQLFQSIRPSLSGRLPCRIFRCNAAQHCDRACSPRKALPDLTAVSNGDLLGACKKALDRAYAVAQILRVSNTVPLPGGGSDPSPARKALEWIAVWGGEDHPYRPVNVPSTKYPQYDLTVPVRGIDVHTRYMIAQAQAPFATTTPAPGRVLPNDPEPVLAPNADVLIFVHGMDSRIEEAENLADALRSLAIVNRKNYTVISVDLPSSGYADTIDHCAIPRPRTSPGFCDSLFALGDPKEFPQFFDAHGQHNAPVLDFIEDFVVSFVDTLETKIPIKSKIRAVVGGSLGGNIAFRMGRRQNVSWLTNIVAWSPASVWDSKVDGATVLGPNHFSLEHFAVKTAWMNAGGNPDELNETEDKRAQFFSAVFDKPYLYPLPFSNRTQPETWTSDRWPCKQAHISAARLDLLEIYNPSFRLWHWRLGGEQLIYSHNGDGPNGQRLYKSNSTRMMLLCGEEDDFTGANICSATQKIAADMNLTPGRAIFMQNTGHSLDNEHPNFVAKQIIAFLGI